ALQHPVDHGPVAPRAGTRHVEVVPPRLRLEARAAVRRHLVSESARLADKIARLTLRCVGAPRPPPPPPPGVGKCSSGGQNRPPHPAQAARCAILHRSTVPSS